MKSYSNLSYSRHLKIYDTQMPFYGFYRPLYLSLTCSLNASGLTFKCHYLGQRRNWALSPRSNTSNQNLEQLTFSDNSFDIVITSDVMEHVRLDDRAHQEIRRVLKPGGVYLFTVPHFRVKSESLIRVAVNDPLDPSKDRS